MGVDFYACRNEDCGETYADCGYYFTCSGCETSFCSDECGGKQTVKDENGDPKEDRYGEYLTSCIHCRLESITSADMVHFLLKKLGLTYDQATDMFRKESKD